MAKFSLLLEFKMKKETVQAAIDQVFKNEYYLNFGTGKTEKYILGIQMDSMKEPIITDHVVLKYNGKGEIRDIKSWVTLI